MFEILRSLGVSDIISLVLTGCGILIFYKIKRWDNKQDLIEAERKSTHIKTTSEINSSINELTTVLKGEIRERKEEAERIMVKSDDLDRAILHDALYTDCRRAIDKGNVTLFELENIETLFKAYKSVYGNGTIEKMFGKVNKLPVVTADGDKEF